jgi:hypothetical protein
MQDRTFRFGWRPAALVAVALAAVAALPSTAGAQYEAPGFTRPALGEDYHAEFGFTLWNPALAGVISSEQFGIVGSEIDFIDDLGFEQTRFRDLRFVLRPGRKHRLRAQYTPVQYTSQTTLNRTIVFNGIAFPINMPMNATFNWKVWRFGYEYDFIYRDRGFVGLLIDVRNTRMEAELAVPIEEPQFTTISAPLPAIGVVGRAYPLPELAINFEVSGFRLPDVDPEYQANYFDWDLNGTVNVNRHVGLQVGWRRMTTFLVVEQDMGEIKFQGMWFGAAVRY